MGLPIGWFSTGRDRAALWLLRTTLEAIREGFLPVEIAFVFCNREDGDDPISDTFLDFVRKVGLSLISFSSRRFLPDLWRRGKAGDEGAMREWRRRYHANAYERLSPFLRRVPFSLLAGYMLIVSDEFCEAHTMLNLHPALPGGPKGAWQEVIWRLILEGASETGVQIHIVTPELDSGPPVTFCRLPLRPPELQPLWEEAKALFQGRSWQDLSQEYGESFPLFREIRHREVLREVPLIHLTLKKLAEGEIVLRGKEVWWQGKRWVGGIDLTPWVETLLKRRGEKYGLGRL